MSLSIVIHVRAVSKIDYTANIPQKSRADASGESDVTLERDPPLRLFFLTELMHLGLEVMVTSRLQSLSPTRRLLATPIYALGLPAP